MLTTAEYVDRKEQQRNSSSIPANVVGVSSLCTRNGKARSDTVSFLLGTVF